MIKIEDSSIIICGIVRNCGKQLLHNLPVINQLCDMAKTYHVVVYENDSVDNTKEVLQNWSSERKNINIISENFDAKKTIPSKKSTTANPFYSYQRISKMTSLRNNYLDYIEKNHLTADYIIVVDLDVAGLNLDGILSSFNVSIDWDAITAYGYSYSRKLQKRYHDSYALVEYKNGSAQTEETIKENQIKFAKILSKNKLVRVDSAYGGLTIYKFIALKDIKYKIINNDNPKVEVRCEHYSLYEQMKEKGYNKIYINSDMTLKYQSISLKFIINYLKRFFLNS